MTKKQKILLAVFLAMFIVPEALFGAITKGIGLPFLPMYEDSQYFTDYPSSAMFVIFLEIIGIIGTLYVLNKKAGLSKKYKYVFNIILWIVLVLLIVALFLIYVYSNISFP